MKNILKVNSIENKIISASFLCKVGQLGKLNSNCSRGRGNWVGGGEGLWKQVLTKKTTNA